jgi:hypothetical protein
MSPVRGNLATRILMNISAAAALAQHPQLVARREARHEKSRMSCTVTESDALQSARYARASSQC